MYLLFHQLIGIGPVMYEVPGDPAAIDAILGGERRRVSRLVPHQGVGKYPY